MICPNCNVHLKYKITARKGETIIKIWTCPQCGADFDVKYHLYNPRNCPKHHWVFNKWNFRDGKDSHEIFWVMKCDRCGAVNEEIRFDSHAVGLREAVDVEDPRVLNLLDLNEQTARFHMEPDEVTDFWKS